MTEHLPDVDKLPAKDQVSLAEFIELMREPVHLQDWMRQYIIDALTDVASLQRQLDEANDTIINRLLPPLRETPSAYLVEFENGDIELHPAGNPPSVGETVTPLYAKEQRPFTAEEAKSYGDFIRDFFDDGDQITQCMVCESRFSDEAAKALKSRVAGSSQPPGDG